MQAEGLNDLINAESEEQSRLSLMQLEGKHSKVYQHLRDELIRLLAHVEAYIDFEADETTDMTADVFNILSKDALKLQG